MQEKQAKEIIEGIGALIKQIFKTIKNNDVDEWQEEGKVMVLIDGEPLVRLYKCLTIGRGFKRDIFFSDEITFSIDGNTFSSSILNHDGKAIIFFTDMFDVCNLVGYLNDWITHISYGYKRIKNNEFWRFE